LWLEIDRAREHASGQRRDGGQYAASVSDVGKHRYLLFDVYVTELYDNWGNTFYSEMSNRK
jgi:hypothetical protein